MYTLLINTLARLLHWGLKPDFTDKHVLNLVHVNDVVEAVLHFCDLQREIPNKSAFLLLDDLPYPKVMRSIGERGKRKGLTLSARLIGILALLVSLPLARIALVLAFLRILPSGWPLAYYRDKPWYVIRTDALDRFGTKLEQRYSRREIETMMSRAGLENIQFSDSQPYWCGVGFKQG